MGSNWKDTLNLPKTSFPMKARLTQREPEQLREWKETDVYQRILDSRKDAPVYSFHDGPPYANGHIHLGHALNKILKDFVIKSKTMGGYAVPFRPGWDCHGLPIELQIEREKGRQVRQMEIHAFRDFCRNYAEKYIDAQRKEFTRLGVFADWENPYRTMDYDYEATIAKAFGECFRKGYVYKGVKSIQWCIHCGTALAEAEVEYHDHNSPTITVKFQLALNQKKKLPEGLPPGETFAVIWTTTPWTLPANLAVAFHPRFTYVAVKCGEETYIVAEELLSSFLADTGLEGKVSGRFSGTELEGIVFRHPFIDRDSVGILAEYVTADAGTGCVHTAPGHGQDDYVSGLRYGLPVLSPVDGKGEFTKEVEHFAGMNVFEANPKIVELLKERGALLAHSAIQHSYPHCWRCKNPLIFRATQQWFVSMEKRDLRKEALDAIEKVEWVPRWGENRIHSMMEQRPDWCISRQRRWGVPITVLTCTGCGKTVDDPAFFENVYTAFSQKGAGVWWERSPADFLPEGYRCEKCGKGEFEKETDILDVWFDSGVSHEAVLGEGKASPWPSEVYLEGSDQHRGWFHTSLLTALMTKGTPPYKKVVTHGFILDGEGKAMSKTEGNVIAPEEIIKKSGAEILRLWVSMVDYRDDLRFSWNLLKTNSDAYLKIRNTFRYMLGNLYDFTPADAISADELPEMERYLLQKLDAFIERVLSAYETFTFHVVYHELVQFCTVTLSAFYLDIVKDRLYCSPPDSAERRSVQTVIYRVADSLVRLMAPILSFTAEELWKHLPERETPSVHMAFFPKPSGTKDAELEKRWDNLLKLRERVNKALEEARAAGELGKALEARVELSPGNTEEAEFLKSYEHVLPELFITSQVSISSPADGELEVKISRAEGEKCSRCWTVTNTPVEHGDGYLCPRCVRVVGPVHA